jgi:hypothetical protein
MTTVRTLFAFAALAALLNMSPANAMGNSGNQATTNKQASQTCTQTQIEALRKEIAELKAQVNQGKTLAEAK